MLSKENILKVYKLTPMQEGIYYHYLMDNDTTAYFQQITFEITGSLQETKVEQTLNQLFKRHDILRTIFIDNNDKLLQFVLKKRLCEFSYFDIIEEKDKADVIAKYKQTDLNKKFNLSKDILFRSTLFKLENNKYVFIWSYHHILLDGWSSGILIGEFIKIYNGFINNQNVSLPFQPPFSDYIQWIENQDNNNSLSFWNNYLSGFEKSSKIVNSNKVSKESYRQVKLGLSFNEDFNSWLIDFCKQEKITISSFIRTTWGILLSKLNNSHDAVFGMVVSGRQSILQSVENMVGLFINTIPVRVKYSAHSSIIDVINENQKEYVEAEGHSYLPLSEIQGLTSQKSNLFDHLFVFENYPLSDHIRNIDSDDDFDLYLSDINVYERSNYNFEFIASHKKALEIEFRFNENAISKSEVVLIQERYVHLLNQIKRKEANLVKDLEIILPDEKSLLLDSCLNKLNINFPQNANIVSKFNEIVSLNGDRIAITIDDNSISYNELNKRAGIVAAYLINRRVLKGSIVSILMSRSIHAISCILGILKSGAAYLPIEKTIPLNRIETILKDSNCQLLITDKSNLKITYPDDQILNFNELIINSDSLLPDINLSSSGPAYVIYTSGTTGKPKGVIINHQNLIRLFFNDNKLFDFNEYDIWSLFHSYSFDFSVWEIFGALLFGGKLIIVKDEIRKNPDSFAQLLINNCVSVLNQTPSSFTNVSSSLIKYNAHHAIRYVIFGGEALQFYKLNDWHKNYPETRLINMYGITETTVHVTYFEIKDEHIKTNVGNIGKSIPTLATLLVDDNNNILPCGISGEIAIAGWGLSKGYLNNPELTHQKFQSITINDLSLRVYKSGDKAILNSTQDLIYQGRIDNQVQIRGFRIELNEIEFYLNKHPDILDCVVSVNKIDDEDRIFLHYVGTNDLRASEIRKYLIEFLPEYMCPAHIIKIDKIPYNINNKINYSELPLNTIQEQFSFNNAPRNEIEKLLFECWCNVLNISSLNITDSFFNIGGDSIKVIPLINIINAKLKTYIKIKDLYIYDTVDKLAKYIKDGCQTSDNNILGKYEQQLIDLKHEVLGLVNDENIEDVYPMSDIQIGMVFHSDFHKSSTLYHDQIIHQLPISDFQPNTFLKAIELIVDKHEILRSAFNLDEYSVPLIIVYKTFKVNYNHIDISNLSKIEQEKAIKSYLKADCELPLDIVKPELWRINTFCINEKLIIFHFTCHHAIIDGWSDALFKTELYNTYQKLIVSCDFKINKLTSSYRNYILEQLAEVENANTVMYWNKELKDYKRFGLFNKTLINADACIKSHTIDVFDDQYFIKLELAAKQYNTSIKNICFSAYAFTMYMFSQSADFVLGIVSNNRPLCNDGEKILGCFLNTVPIRITIPVNITWLQFIKYIDAKLSELKKYDRISLPRIAKAIGEEASDRNLFFDSFFNFLDFHVYNTIDHLIEESDLSQNLEVKGQVTTNMFFHIDIEITRRKFILTTNYNKSFFNDSEINTFIQYFKSIIDAICDTPKRMVSKQYILTSALKSTDYTNLNSTEVSLINNPVILEILQHNNIESNRDCIFNKNQALNYNYFYDRVLRLASYLREVGVRPNSVVAIGMERSPELLIGIFAIIYAGGAYLPLNPADPIERLKFFINDSNAQVLISDSDELLKLGVSCKKIQLMNFNYEKHKPVSLEIVNTPEDIAYIIYTSGTTGKPKGVCIEHKSLVNRLLWMRNYLNLNASDTFLLKTPHTFDVSVWEIFLWNICQANIVVLEKGEEKNPAKIIEAISNYNISILHFVPSMYGAFVDFYISTQNNLIGNKANLKSLKYIIASGEALLSKHVDSFKKYIQPYSAAKLINLYGPTEATIDVTYYDTDTVRNDRIVPIGKPIDNTKLYIFDDNGQVQPIGVPGELCIGGIGLSRGYLNNPDLTHDRFIVSTNLKGERLYKTGDICCLLKELNIQYVGREDTQVKLRGNRIEISEIEFHLERHVKINTAVVLLISKCDSDLHLSCFYIPNQNITEQEIILYLKNYIPDYMIPSRFSLLEKLPVTKNGKLDRNKLKELETHENLLNHSEENITEDNILLLDIWKDVLGLNNLSINDNFFRVGGDSIKAIQIVAKLHRKGFTCELIDLYKNPTIKDLSTCITPTEEHIIEYKAEGKISITPIQKWFFDNYDSTLSHFNQSVLFNVPAYFTKELLEEIFNVLSRQHEALKIIIKKQNDDVIQEYQVDSSLEIKEYTINSLAGNEQSLINEYCNNFQSDFNIFSGKSLARISLIKLNEEKLLFIVMHHLIIDGISWRILFEDLQILIDQHSKNEKLILPPKTATYKQWSENIYQYSRNNKLLKEYDYWKDVTNKQVPQFPIIDISKSNYAKDSDSVTQALSKQQTKYLLTEISKHISIDVNELLLSALARSISKVLNISKLHITLESHGREQVVSKIDISRTVGWFTSFYPVYIEDDLTNDALNQLIYIKEIIRKVPNKGIGYGILKYAANKDLNQPSLISFNYLGQFDSDLTNKEFSISDYPQGNQISPESKRQYLLDVVCLVQQGQLKTAIGFNKNYFESNSISKLADEFILQIDEMVKFCLGLSKRVSTPTDFTYNKITQAQLSTLLSKYKISDIYPLTPMQKGMLFYSVSNKTSQAYFEQIAYRINGKLSLKSLKESYNQLVFRHDMLRIIINKDFTEPFQIVKTNCDCDFRFFDYSLDSCLEKVDTFKVKDREEGFDLFKGPLMRLSIIKILDSEYEFVWSFHHIIMDGWCLGILQSEMMQLYNNFELKSNFQLPKAQSFKNYIDWLNETDSETAKNYWADYLSDMQSVKLKLKVQSNDDLYICKDDNFEVPENLSKQLKKLSGDYNVTLSNVLKTVWSILLSIYNNTNDVVFGIVVSGRPAEVVGIDQSVGLFINTIPVRLRFNNSDNFSFLVNKIQQHALESEAYQYLPLNEIQALTKLRSELFDHIFVIENYPVAERLKNANADKNELEVKEVTVFEQTHYDFNIILNIQESIKINIKYNSVVYSQQSVNDIFNHFKFILEQVVNNYNIKINDIKLIETQFQLKSLLPINNTAVSYPDDQAIIEIFDCQAELYPQKIVVSSQDNQFITYSSLKEYSIKFASYLQGQGVVNKSIIGIAVDRSIESIISILSVLRLNCTFIPIEYDLPDARLNYIINDSNIYYLLAKTDKFKINHTNINILDIDKILKTQEKNTNFKVISNVNVPAYIMYTSGSTGNPKGAIIKQKSILRLFFNTNYIQIRSTDYILQLSNLAFDGSTFDIFGALLTGASLVLVEHNNILDLNKLGDYISKRLISVFLITTSLFNKLVDSNLKSLIRVRKILTGGEKISNTHALKAFNYLGPDRIIHVYGPTENTVFSTFHTINEFKDIHDIPIGKPISNTKVFISKGNNLLPFRIIGEIFLSGEGVSEGYLNNIELTHSKFVWVPEISDSIIYKSGDLGVMDEDGSITFINRIDNQVKINGFRIELEEIEAQLKKLEIIEDAVVCIDIDQSGTKSIIAYLVSDKPLIYNELIKEARRNLPFYMLPAQYFKIDSVPLNKNGKINRKELSQLKSVEIKSTNHIILPQTEQERVLLDVCSEVLMKKDISLIDDFFELGGDSIKIIQLISKTSSQGYRLKVKDIFNNSILSELALRMELEIATIDQQMVCGENELTPIQNWFMYKSSVVHKSHFNQSALFKLNSHITIEILTKVIVELVRHHDALRSVLRVKGNKIVQFTGDDVDSTQIDYFDLINLTEWKSELERLCEQEQKSLDIYSKSFLKVALFRITENEFRVLIVLHHLVSDGISWRILIEDINLLINKYLNNLDLKLPLKTNSYINWSRALYKYSVEKLNSRECEYWRNINQTNIDSIPTDYNGKNTVDSIENIYIRLNKETTLKLMHEVSKAYNTNVNDILLTAFLISLNKAFGLNAVKVMFESHGREGDLLNINITRTVGWFTCMYPVLFYINNNEELGYLLKTVKDTLRNIPSKGISYGIYNEILNDNSSKNSGVQISFNYLGDIDSSFKSDNILQKSSESMGMLQEKTEERDFLLDVIAIIMDAQLQISIKYSKNNFHQETAEALKSKYNLSLLSLIDHCTSKKHRELTLSDLTYKNLTENELESITKKYQIKDICQLSPMQKDKLFYSLTSNNYNSGHVQIIFNLHGKINLVALNSAINELIERHEILRINYHFESLKEPVQFIHVSRKLNILYEDYSVLNLTDEELKEKVNNYKKSDALKRYDLTSDVLIRFALLKLADNEYCFVWSFHHILMDGWCIGLLIKEFNILYSCYLTNGKIQLPTPVQYTDYIKYLNQLSIPDAIKYWKNYLHEMQTKKFIPTKIGYNDSKEELNSTKVHSIKLSNSLSDALRQMASENNITVNSIMQVIWALVLSKVNSTDDIIFGMVSSGRGLNFTGVDQLVGLVMNTLPFRIKFNDQDLILDLARKTQQERIENESHGFISISEIKSVLSTQGQLIDHLFVFENYPLESQLYINNNEDNLSDFYITNFELNEQVDNNFNVAVYPNTDISISFYYNAIKYESRMVQFLSDVYVKFFMELVESERKKVSEFNIENFQDKIDNNMLLFEKGFNF